MRLFVGLDLPDSITAAFGATIDSLKPAAPGLRWSPVRNLHITTKFIGSWPDTRLHEMKSALAAIVSPAFEVELSGFGWFPNPHAPRIFWVGAKGGGDGEGLAPLFAATEAATAALGVAKEKEVYHPHVTLARVNPGTDVEALRGAVAEIPNTKWGRIKVRAFYLYASHTTPTGSVYTKLAGVPLQAT